MGHPSGASLNPGVVGLPQICLWLFISGTSKATPSVSEIATTSRRVGESACQSIRVVPCAGTEINTCVPLEPRRGGWEGGDRVGDGNAYLNDVLQRVPIEFTPIYKLESSKY